jgi:hypothetical protein
MLKEKRKLWLLEEESKLETRYTLVIGYWNKLVLKNCLGYDISYEK